MNTKTQIGKVALDTLNKEAVENITQFKNYLLDNAYSNNTINGYCFNLKSYSMYCEKTNKADKSLNTLTRANIVDYKNYLRNVSMSDSKTINNKLSSLKKYNEYLLENNRINTIAIVKKDMCKIQTEFANPTDITKDDISEFVNNIKKDRKKSSVRDYAIVTLLCYTGLRISECINLKIANINLNTKEITVVGKGNKQRLVFLNDKTVNALNEYITLNRNHNNYGEHINSPHLFISNRSDKLTIQGINQMFDKYNSNIHPHSLRHFFCTHALESGMNIHEIAAMAGHSNLATTMRYTNPTKETLKNKMNIL